MSKRPDTIANRARAASETGDEFSTSPRGVRAAAMSSFTVGWGGNASRYCNAVRKKAH